ncbi:tripartite tricarboxylate transporter TctB family protein [Alkalihalobacillus sp. BA299]|uniref:tripartite tricarboxylate transporter TctB family protein n=1 Tax=Alkalihalobacillus sp. BA299 TaxID=2815938 RepID=UPI001ADA17C3|nr:tripartite tricarboxylate transporter TctB family protein [Alkalihalobacillus sp. BA299]
MGEILIGIALIIICIVIYSQSGDFPYFNEVHLNAGSFPKLIAVLLGILSLMLVISKAKELLSQKAEIAKLDLREYLRGVYKEHKLVFFTLISLFLYIFIMQFIGFVLTTIVFIITTGLIIGPKKKKNIFIISVVAVVITFSTYLFFENVLHVRFPSGLFF